MIRQAFPVNEAGEPAAEGLVLRTLDYKDHDGIIHLARPEGIYSFYARGIQKQASKNRRLSLPFSRVRLEYEPKYSNSLLFLIHGSVQRSYLRNAGSLEHQSVNAVLVSLIERHSMNPFVFEHLEACWQAGEQTRESLFFLHACLILAEMLHQSGTLMNVSACTVCSSKERIAGVSMSSGGFVCQNHLDDTAQRWPKKRLLQLRRLVQAVMLEDFPDRKLEDFDWTLEFFIFLAEWYVYHNDLSLRSLEFLKTIAPRNSEIRSE